MKSHPQTEQSKRPNDFNSEVGKVFTEVRDYYLDYFGAIEKEIAERRSQRSLELARRDNREKGNYTRK